MTILQTNRLGACLLLIMFIFLCFNGLVKAKVIAVSEANGYAGIDTVDSIWENRYNIQVMEGRRINYEFTVVGPGTIKVYFLKSSDYSFLDDITYYTYHSQDSPVSSFSGSFVPKEDDGDSFTILVQSGTSNNVTYNANIFVDIVSTGEKALGCTLGILIILGLFVFTFFKLKLYKKFTEATTPPPKHRPNSPKNLPVRSTRKQCPSCGGENSHSNEFCVICGARFP